MWADNGYSGEEMARIAKANGIELGIVKRNHKKGDGFVLQAKRWIVERTFGWLNRYRRFSKDYEYLTATSECMIYLGMSRTMVRRIAKLA
jgi:putative transposase